MFGKILSIIYQPDNERADLLEVEQAGSRQNEPYRGGISERRGKLWPRPWVQCDQAATACASGFPDVGRGRESNKAGSAGNALPAKIGKESNWCSCGAGHSPNQLDDIRAKPENGECRGMAFQGLAVKLLVTNAAEANNRDI